VTASYSANGKSAAHTGTSLLCGTNGKHTGNKKVNQSHYRPEVPRGFQEVKVPRLRGNGPGWW